MVFPVVTYGYESWTIKESEHGRMDAFELLALFGRPLYNRTSVQATALARECQAVPKREEPANSYSWQPGKGKCALNPQ